MIASPNYCQNTEYAFIFVFYVFNLHPHAKGDGLKNTVFIFYAYIFNVIESYSLHYFSSIFKVKVKVLCMKVMLH